MIGNSVVPGLPNRWVMPSSLSSARKAERPVMRFFISGRFLLPGPVARGVSQHEQTWRVDAMECAHACLAWASTHSKIVAGELERIVAGEASFSFRALPDHTGKALQRYQRFAEIGPFLK